MPTCQGQHPDASPCRNPAPQGQTRCYIHRRPDPSAPLTREDVLAAIEEKRQEDVVAVIAEEGTSGALDLSHENLDHIHLCQAYLEGVDLHGASLEGADLRKASLAGADLRETWADGADLQEANLESANLGGAILQSANLRGSDLLGANLQRAHLLAAKLLGANLISADLREADLGLAHFEEADLRHARLERVDFTRAARTTGVRWYGVFLEKTRMVRDKLGEKIGDDLEAERGDCPYNVAREAYLALKTNFNELGRYDDASWAYRKERRMERAMSWPRRAAKEHKEGKERLEKEHPWLGRPWFYIRHTLKWMADGLVQWATNYGESPGRVLGWAALLLLVAYPLIYYVAGGSFAPCCDPWAFAVAFVLDYPDNLLLSAGSFSTLELRELATLGTATRFWAASEAMLGISLLALLMFTLGNRISRS